MRFVRLFSMVLVCVLLVVLGVAQAAPTTSIPMPRPTVAPRQPAPIVPVAIKRRWRVNAKMTLPDGTWRFVYITWYGYPHTIDWSTAAVCERITYRFWSPWERWGTTFQILGAPVDDMNTPIN